MIEKNTINKISVAIITYNEESVIERCLKSACFADEIVIVDSGSVDETCNIARKYGAKIFFNEFVGYGAQKRFAVDMCSNDWVLIIDSDEELEKESYGKILKILCKHDCNAYSFKRNNYFNNKLIRFGSWGSDEVVRLFNKKFCHVSDFEVHESVVCDSFKNINCEINHFPRRSISSFLEKANKYSSIWSCSRKNKKTTIAGAIFHGGWCFIFNYFFRFGFLDGSEGLIIAFSDMVDTFFKYAKLWELSQKSDHAN